MQLPPELRSRIADACDQVARRDLASAAKGLSDAYRDRERPSQRRLTKVDTLAYAATRMPATYAVLRRVFSEIAGPVASLFDIGAGTGAGAWAIRESLGTDVRITCEERDPAMLELGRTLTPFAQWTSEAVQEADVVVLSYVLGELTSAADVAALVGRAWQSARRYLVVVEPGTPRGFARIAALRGHEGTIVAPCPHKLACPMEAAKDWCHFAARVERTALHRQLKGGELSHEDEKFSYLILARGEAEAARSPRIVRHPQIEAGHIQLQLCQPDGRLATYDARKRSNPVAFKQARKAEWGDTYETP
ncbi:rRNA methyltransferase [Bryobacterales bacterium F-183]|nr:rRNA methyltransferase [Bryobacterales bacterium F-183]